MRPVIPRADPSPSRLRYRLERMRLTPGYRRLLRVGLPLLVLAGLAGGYLHDADRRADLAARIAEIRRQIETRPEFMVHLLELDGASDGVQEDIREIFPYELPASSFDLDMQAIREMIEELPAVKRASLRIRQGGVLSVAVTEREPVALWRTRHGFEVLDITGARIDVVAARGDHPDLPVLAGDGADPLDEKALDRLPAEVRPRAERVFAALDHAFALAGKRSLRDRVEGAWLRLGGAHCLQNPASEAAEAGLFLDTLESAEQQGLIDDWNDFEELLDQAFTEGDAPDESVRLEILTMHGAKGLEWDLVVLPGLNRGTGGNGRELLYWLPFTPEQGDEQVLLSPLRAAWQPDNTPLINLIRSEQQARDEYENQRLLYVAATRARRELVVSAVLDPQRDSIAPARGSLLEILWPRAGRDFLESLESSLESEHTSGTDVGTPMPDQSIRRVPDGWQPPIGNRLTWTPKLPPHEREVEIEFNWAGAQARRSGSVLHALLERVGNIGIESLEAEQKSQLSERIPQLLRTLGTGPEALDETTAMIAAAFDNTLTSETGRWILSGRHQDAACELALTGMVDGRLINAVIDRTFIDEHGTRWIIDYKSGYHEGGDLQGFLAEEAGRYESQLGLYRRLFEQMGEADIKTALYLPRHGELREV